MKKLLFLFLISAATAQAQGVRVPINIQTVLTVAGVTNVVGVPSNPIVAFCSAPANGAPCTNKATTYTDATLGTPCSTSTQFVLDGTNTCVASLNAQAQGGVWVAAGQYAYTVTINGVNLGPYFVTAGGSGGGGSGVAAPAFSVQYANSTVTAQLGAAGVTTPDGNSLVVKGPNPLANLAAFTRPVTGIGGCSTTATINIGAPTTATLASGACFQTNNGLFNDGITIYGAGANVTISSPSAPTVTPNTISVGGVNLGGTASSTPTVVNGATGASTYSYILVAFDRFGGFAAPSAATTITNGPSSLGLSALSCAISTESRSGNDVTVNFSSPCAGAVVGAMMFIPNSSAGTFGGFYGIKTVNSSSQVVYAGQYNSASFGWNSTDNSTPGTNSSTGGTAYFITSNHLNWTYGTGVWRYGICAERPGDVTYHAIGMTRPSTSIAKDIQSDDYGATMMANFKLPSYFTDAVCNGAAGLPDPLTTTITAGAGTTTVTLANAATNGVTGATAVYDSGPGLIAAATSISSPWGELYIPPTAFNSFYSINSFTVLPATIKIRQAGALAVGEPIEIQGSTVWTGDSSAQGGPTAFSYFNAPTAVIEMVKSSPTIYIAGDGVWLKELNFLTPGSANWGSFIVDDAAHTRFSNIGLSPDGATDSDFLSIPLVLRGGNGSADCQYDLDHIGFGMNGYSTTPGSWNPAIYVPFGACIINLSKVSVGLHGIIQAGGGVDWNIDNVDRQGGVMPFLWHINGSVTSPEFIKFNTVSLDTDGASLFSTANNLGARYPDNVKGYGIRANGGTTFGGFGPSSLDIYSSVTTTLPNASGGFARQCASISSGLISMNCNFDYNAYIGPNAKIYTPLAAPTGLSNSAVSGGTNTASIAVQFKVVAYDPAGNYTIASVASNSATTDGTCPGSGNCQFQLGWTPVIGAVNYTVIGCQVSGSPLVLFNCPTYTNIPSATNITTNPVTMNGLSAGTSLPNVSINLAGSSGWTAGALWGPLFAASEGTAPTCSTNYDVLFGIASGHRLSFCDNAGSVDQVVGAATTDTLTNKTVSAGTYTGAGSGSGSILLTGQRDGLVPVNATTTTPCTFGTSSAGCFDKAYVTGYAFNQHATAAQAITYNLPTAAAGKQFCVANSYNGSNPNTGVITVATSASGQFIIFTDGTLSASGGNVTSGGAAADAACFVGVDSTHWQQFTQQGTWTKH